MPAAIEVRDVHKRFGEQLALSGIDLEIRQGEFFGLLGPNGAGKTTLISVLAGLARPDRGSARVMGHDVRTDYRARRTDRGRRDRKSTRLNSSHLGISYAVFCLKKKKSNKKVTTTIRDR